MTPITSNVLAVERSDFVSVVPSSWPGLREGIIDIEQKSFPASIRDSVESLYELVCSSTSIFLALRFRSDRDVVGYVVADLLEKFPDIPGVATDPCFGRDNTIYVYSVAVQRDWSRRGLGVALQKECLRRASFRGIERATAHVRSGALDRMRLGGRVIASFKNWYDTGSTFDYMEFLTSLGR